jgi:hypothetical protein
MGLLGEVVRMDVDGEGKASGPFLRARVAIDISKPIRRGALINRSKDEPPEWFDAQYESCRISIVHVECWVILTWCVRRRLHVMLKERCPMMSSYG